MFGKQEEDWDPYAAAGNRWVPMMHFCFYALVCLALVVIYALLQFRGLREPVAMETAQIARHLANGEGFVTDCVRPFDLSYLAARDRLPAVEAPIPVLWSAPGLPMLQSLVLRVIDPPYALDVAAGGHVIPAEAQVIVPLGILLFLLTVLAVWLLGRSLFDGRIAFMAAAVYAVSDLALAGAISGLPVTLSTPAVMFTLWLAILAVRRSASVEGGWGVVGLMLLAGLAGGVAVLADYAMMVVVVAVAVFLGIELQRRRWLGVTLFLLVVAFILVPWVMRNRAAGIGLIGAWPYGALRETTLFPVDTLERSVDPVFNVYRVSAAVRQGIAERLIRVFGGVGLARGGIMICFFVLALFQRIEKSFIGVLKLLSVAAVVLLVLLPPVPGMEAGAGWLALYPLLVVLGMGACMHMLEQEAFFDAAMRPLLLTALLLLCLLPAALHMVRGSQSVYPPYNAAIQHFVGGVPDAGMVLLTDIPWATAWYGGCKSVLIPNRPETVPALAGMDWNSVGGLYLTGMGAGDTAWSLMRLGRQVPDPVPLRSGVNLPIGRTDQLLLTHDDRWSAE